MVEGPGCTNNGKKISSIVGFKVIQITTISNTQQEATKTHLTENTQDGTHLAGKAPEKQSTLKQVITIGKELFLIFQKGDEEVALRLHFGMNGSLILEKRYHKTHKDVASYVNANSKDKTRGDRLAATLDMTLVHPTSNDQVVIVKAYQTTISNLISAKAPRLKYEHMKNRDICSPDFDINVILEDLCQQDTSSFSEALISDVLLHQNILPGIGNIIKVEGLHDARVNPKRILKTLLKDDLYNIIMSCRTIALIWLKSGKSPPKRVYNQTVCGTCARESIAMAKVGQTDRTTFWCRYCQTMESGIFVLGEDPKNRKYEANDIDEIHDVEGTVCTKSSSSSLPSSCDPHWIPKLRKVCSIHGPDGIVLRRCRKGIHEQRIFFSCKVRNCNYFCWADGSFPSCTCGKRVVMRISKTETSGGKWFFHCSERKDAKDGKRSSCGYFKWVDEESKKGFGHLLTPLL